MNSILAVGVPQRETYSQKTQESASGPIAKNICLGLASILIQCDTRSRCWVHQGYSEALHSHSFKLSADCIIRIGALHGREVLACFICLVLRFTTHSAPFGYVEFITRGVSVCNPCLTRAAMMMITTEPSHPMSPNTPNR